MFFSFSSHSSRIGESKPKKCISVSDSYASFKTDFYNVDSRIKDRVKKKKTKSRAADSGSK